MVCRNAFAAAFLGLSLHAVAQAPLSNVLTAEDSPSAKIILQGTPLGVSTASHGLSIGVADLYEDGTASSDILSVGTFTLRRTKGNFLWKYQNAAKPVLSLDENGTLALSDPLSAQDLVLTPGVGGGITLGGVPLFTGLGATAGGMAMGDAAHPVSLSVTGSLAIGGATTLPYPDDFGPGLLAAGAGANAGPTTQWDG